jgi:23S rRNA (uracil1939-C5)-methyltransferase
MTVDVAIERVGARGDGIARHGGRTLYVPLTVPGDRVRVRLGPARGEGVQAEVVELLEAGPGRAVPPCRHFGRCGGCALQHLDDALYVETKRAQVVEALARHRLAGIEVAPLVRTPPRTRRRARLTLRHGRAGFQRRSSHEVEDMAECHILVPPLFALVAPLRRLAAKMRASAASLTLAEPGVDLVIDVARAPSLEELETLAAFAEAHDVARLSWRVARDIIPLAQRRPVRVSFAGVAVDLPPDAFLQASRDGEAALTEAVLAALASSRRVADLHAGLGTLTFAIAATGARVHAVEGVRDAHDALRAAAHRSMLPHVTAAWRDLDADPLRKQELTPFDAVVFDPPRAGAKAQAEALVLSPVPLVVAVSCNPATFARDAATLIAGGYRLERVLPIDQFVWSTHVELVAAFRRQ